MVMTKNQAVTIIALLILIIGIQSFSLFGNKLYKETEQEKVYDIVHIARKDRDAPDVCDYGFYSHECAKLFNQKGVEFIGVVSKNGLNGSFVLIRRPRKN